MYSNAAENFFMLKKMSAARQKNDPSQSRCGCGKHIIGSDKMTFTVDERFVCFHEMF